MGNPYRGLLIPFAILCAIVLQDAQAGLSAMKERLEDVQVTLPEAEVTKELEGIQALNGAAYAPDLDRQVSRWCTPLKVEGALSYPLKYTNPEIVDRVVRVYIDKVKYERAYTAALRRGDAPPLVDGGTGETVTSEAPMDFYTMLGDMAESTLSEALYDYIWDYPHPSSFRPLYLAHVFPERTIARLTGAQLGRTIRGKQVGEDALFVEDAVLGTSVYEALEYLAAIAELHPDIRKSKREALIAFVERHGLHYAPSDSARHPGWRDYRARRAAMRILALVGTREDLPLLEALAHNPPGPGPARNSTDPEGLSALADSIADRLHGATKPDSGAPATVR